MIPPIFRILAAKLNCYNAHQTPRRGFCMFLRDANTAKLVQNIQNFFWGGGEGQEVVLEKLRTYIKSKGFPVSSMALRELYNF
jgi:hypothetical protein